MDETFVAPGNGGGGTHTHVANGHIHVGDAHVHSVSGDSQTQSTVACNAMPLGSNICAPSPHTHDAADSASTTLTYVSEIVSVTSPTAHPEYVKVIVISPAAGGKLVPDGAVVLADTNAVTGSGFDILDGTGGLPDYDGKFLLGADAAGDGGATGGSTTHNHTSAAHDHDIDDHEHASKQCGMSNPTSTPTAAAAPYANVVLSAHHNVALTPAVALSDCSSDAITINNASSNPAYIKLLGVENTSGAPSLVAGLVFPFFDDPDNLPDGWVLCDGNGGTIDCRDAQVMMTKTPGQIGDTGGSNTHTHTSPAHGHTHGQHRHTRNTEGDAGNATSKQGAGADPLNASISPWHSHTWTCGFTTPTMQDATVTLQNADIRQPYRTMVWVKFAGMGRIVTNGPGPIIQDGRIRLAG